MIRYSTRLFLAYFTKHNTLQVHPYCYKCIIFHYVWGVCVRVPHFFICLSDDRHLGCFYILAVINDAAMNTEVHVSFLISIFVFFGYIPSNGSPASYDSFFNIYYLFIYF